MNAPVPPLLRASAIAGILAAAYGAGAWFDCAPGGWRLRSLFEEPAARSARNESLHILGRLHAFAAEEPSAARGAVLLLGSSTIERWPLADSFPGKRVLDHGLSGATLERIERLFDACLPAAPPAGVVLYAGSADLRFPTEPLAQALARLPRLVQRLRVRYGPSLPITLLGILPARHMDEVSLHSLADANETLRVLARENALAFVPTARPPLAGSDGALPASLADGDLHLNLEGYRVLTRWLVTEGGEAGRALAP
jgi:lysophospholipase L1-like esterase